MSHTYPIHTDMDRRIKWGQYVNAHGVTITIVHCMETGWSNRSNQYQMGAVTGADLDTMLSFIRETAARQSSQPRQSRPHRPLKT